MIDEAHLTKMIYDLQTDRGNVVGLPITLEEQLNKLCQVKHFRFGIFNNTDFALEWCERLLMESPIFFELTNVAVISGKRHYSATLMADDGERAGEGWSAPAAILAAGLLIYRTRTYPWFPESLETVYDRWKMLQLRSNECGCRNCFDRLVDHLRDEYERTKSADKN